MRTGGAAAIFPAASPRRWSAAGAILLSALAGVGVTVGTHILRCGDVWDRPFAAEAASDVAALREAPFPTLDP